MSLLDPAVAPVVVGVVLMWAACLTPFVVAILYVLDVMPGHWGIRR